MSQLYVDNIRNRTGGPIGIPTGAVVTGVLTATTGNITGNMTVGGVLTYEDVTNVDSVGVVTARSGIEFGASGVGGTITATGQAEFAGVCTASSFSGSFDGSTASFSGNVSIADSIFHTGDTDTSIRFPAVDTFTVETAGSEAIRVDSSQRLLVSTTSSRSTAGTGADLQVETTDAGGRISVVQNRNDANPCPFVVIGKSRGTSIGSNTVLQDDDRIGAIVFAGADGTDMGSDAARIIAEVDGTPGSNDMPGRLILSTTSDGSDSATERLRITSTGGVHFNNAELIERVNIVANKLSAVPNVNLDNGMVHYYTTNETTTTNPNIITTAGINTNMATGDTMSVTIMSKPNGAGYFPRISIDGRLAGITTYWNGGSAPSSAQSSGVDANTYQIIKTADATFDVLANTSNFA